MLERADGSVKDSSIHWLDPNDLSNIRDRQLFEAIAQFHLARGSFFISAYITYSVKKEDEKLRVSFKCPVKLKNHKKKNNVWFFQPLKPYYLLFPRSQNSKNILLLNILIGQFIAEKRFTIPSNKIIPFPKLTDSQKEKLGFEKEIPQFIMLNNVIKIYPVDDKWHYKILKQAPFRVYTELALFNEVEKHENGDFLFKLHYKIDPRFISPKDQIIIEKLITHFSQQAEYYVDALKAIPFPHLTEREKEILGFSDTLSYKAVFFNHAIAIRPCKEEADTWHYDVFSGAVVGSGRGGGVREISHSGRFKKRADGSLQFQEVKPKHRVGKIPYNFNPEDNSYKSRVINEYELTNRVRRIKLPTFFSTKGNLNKELRAFLIMPFLQGEVLERVLERDQRNKARKINDIETLIRVKLSRKLAQALRELHLRGIIWRDAKPLNILVSLEGGVVRVKLMDFDLSCAVERKKDGRFPGSPYYAPPDAFSKMNCLDEATDIFSLQRIYLRLFRGTFPDFGKLGSEECFDALHRFSLDCRYQELGLFAGMDLSKEDCEQLITLFKRMENYRVKEPCTLEEVIAFFDAMELKLLPSACESAFQEGLRMRRELMKLFTEHTVLIDDQAAMMKAIFLKALKAIPDKPLMVTACFDRLSDEEGFFQGLTSKREIMEVLQQKIDGFISAYQRLVALTGMLRDLETPHEKEGEVENLLINIKATLKKSAVRPTMENVDYLKSRFEKRILKTEALCAALDISLEPQHPKRLSF